MIFRTIFSKIFRGIYRFLLMLVRLFINHRLFTSILIIFACLAIADFYFSRHGLPITLQNKLCEYIHQEYKIKLKADSINFGFWNGICIKNTTVWWDSQAPAMTAEELSCSTFSLLTNYRNPGTTQVQLKNAKFFLPWSKKSIITNANVNATIFADWEALAIHSLSCEFFSIPFTISGFVQNPFDLNKLTYFEQITQQKELAKSTPEHPAKESKIDSATPSFSSKAEHLTPFQQLRSHLFQHQDEIQYYLGRLHRSIANQTNSKISLYATIDNQKRSYQIEGIVELHNINLPNLAVRDVEAKIHLNDKEPWHSLLRLIIDQDSHIMTQVTLTPQHQLKINGTGVLTPQILQVIPDANVKKVSEDLSPNYKFYFDMQDFTLDLKKSLNLQALNGKIHFNIPHIVFQQIPLSNIDLHLHFANAPEITALLKGQYSDEEAFKFDCIYHADNQSFKSHGNATLALRSIQTHLPFALPNHFNQFNPKSQILFTGDIRYTPQKKWQVKTSVDALLTSKTLPNAHLVGHVNYQDNLIDITGLQIRTKSPDNLFTGEADAFVATAEGEFHIDLNQGLITSGKFKSKDTDNHLLRLCGIHPRQCRAKESELRLIIYPSTLYNPTHWNLSLNGKIKQITIGNHVNCSEMTFDLAYKENSLFLQRALLNLASPQETQAHYLNLEGDFRYDLSSKMFLGTWIGQFLDQDTEPDNGLRVTGSLTFNKHRLQAKLDPQALAIDQIYRRIFYLAGIPENDIGSRITLHGKPAELSNAVFTLPLRNPKEWRASTDLHLYDSSYIDWKVREAVAHFEINRHEMIFSDISGTTALGEPLHNIYLSLNFFPIILKIKGMANVDPRFAEVFIDYKPVKNIYKRIWDGVVFNPEMPPYVRLDDLQLTYEDETDDLTFKIRGLINAQHFSYNNVAVEEAQANIDINPEEYYDIDNIRIRMPQSSIPTPAPSAPIEYEDPHNPKEPNAIITGKVNFTGDTYPIIHFNLNAQNITPAPLLTAFVPDYAAKLAKLNFIQGNNHSCRGIIQTGTLPKIKLSGQSYLDVVSWDQQFNVQNCHIDWRLQDNNELYWNITRADVFQGKISSTGTYDLMTNKALVTLNLDSISLAQANAFAQLQKQDKTHKNIPQKIEDINHRGYISGMCRVELLKNWSDIPWQINGNGNLHINATNLWNIPLFTGLAKAIDKNSILGVISELDADFQFQGQKIAVNFGTNGTLIALNGTGDYFIDTNKVALRVTGAPLKDWRLFSWLLEPLSWLFEIELHGTPKDYKWYFVRGYKGWFSSKPKK